MNDSTKAAIMRMILAFCIFASILTMYRVFVVEKNFEVIYTEDGSNPIPE